MNISEEHVDHAELSEAVHENANVISEPQDEQDGEAAEYYRGDVIPTTSNVDVVLKPNLGRREEHHIMMTRSQLIPRNRRNLRVNRNPS